MDSCGIEAALPGRPAGAAPTGRFTERTSAAKRALYITVFAALGAACGLIPACRRGPSKPPVLLVVVEGVRADRTSAYGYARQTTPRLEALVHDGATFERAYASSPDPLAGLASLLSGRYPPEHGVLLKRTLDPSVETLAETLAAAGYATHAVLSQPAVTAESGLLQGFGGIETVDPAESGDIEGGAAEVSRRAVEWLRSGWDGRSPFLLALIYSSPQLPFSPPEPFRYRFMDEGVNRARVDAIAEFWLPFAQRYTARRMELGAGDMQTLRDLYDAELAYADDRVGAVLTALRERRLLDRMLVVVTSDRGEDLGEEHRLADETSLREAALRVPLVMRMPGRIPPRTRVEGVAQDVDVSPTICDLLGVPRPAGASAQALALLPPGAATRAAAVSIAIRPVAENVQDLLVTVRDERFRYYLAPDGRAALFDMASDPQGLLDVLEAQKAAAVALDSRLRAWEGSLKVLPGALPRFETVAVPGIAPPPDGPAAAPRGAPAGGGGR